MKINRAELLQIIKEEAGKLKKTRALIAEMAEIKKRLQECGCELEEDMEEAFLGIMGASEKARQAALITQLDAFLAQGAMGDREKFIDEFKQDNHQGTLSLKKAGGQNPQFVGKNIIIYTPRPTAMQNIAAGTSSQTTGGGTGAKQAGF